MDEIILELINRKERQILVHSIMYYRLGESIWDDKMYDGNAKFLQELTIRNPEEFKASVLYEEFKEFDWTTGMNLPLWHPKYEAIARSLLAYDKSQKEAR